MALTFLIKALGNFDREACLTVFLRSYLHIPIASDILRIKRFPIRAYLIRGPKQWFPNILPLRYRNGVPKLVLNHGVKRLDDTTDFLPNISGIYRDSRVATILWIFRRRYSERRVPRTSLMALSCAPS